MSEVIAPAIAERAVEWLVALQSPPVSAQTLAQWQQWRASDPEHERAWQRIEAFGQRFEPLAHNSHIAHSTLTMPTGLDRRQALKALALLVAAGGTAWAGRDLALVQDLRADYHSGVGEQRRLTLADGSRILLNTDSAVDVSFDAGTRLLRLLRGEVQIQVATDSAGRLFQAQTREGRIETPASRFVLRQERGYSHVAVREGALMLYAQGQAGVAMQAGQQAMFSSQGLGPLRSVSEAEQAWTDGIIVANDRRLADFLAELGRYRHGHLGCSQTVADIRVAGTYPLADTDTILQTLGATLHLEVRRFTPYWVTLEAKRGRV